MRIVEKPMAYCGMAGLANLTLSSLALAGEPINESWQLTAVLNLLITYVIGLLPALLIRFGFLRRPIASGSKLHKLGILFFYGLGIVALFMVIAMITGENYKQSIHPYVITLISYAILRIESRSRARVRTNEHKANSNLNAVSNEEQQIPPEDDSVGKTEIKTTGQDNRTGARNMEERGGFRGLKWLAVSGVCFAILVAGIVFGYFIGVPAKKAENHGLRNLTISKEVDYENLGFLDEVDIPLMNIVSGEYKFLAPIKPGGKYELGYIVSIYFEKPADKIAPDSKSNAVSARKNAKKDAGRAKSNEIETRFHVRFKFKIRDKDGFEIKELNGPLHIVPVGKNQRIQDRADQRFFEQVISQARDVVVSGVIEKREDYIKEEIEFE